MNVTAQSAWTSSRPAVATINTTNNRGLATPVAVGTTTITATFMGLTATTTLTLIPQPTITTISVTPITPVVPLGTVVQFTATAIYSDGTTQNVTGGSTWVSSAPGVLAVTTAGGARGRGTGVAGGTATVTATFMGLSGSTTATVSTAVLTSVSVSPAGVTLAVGARRQFTATAIYSDGSSRDVTALAVWLSSAPAVAGVSDAGATRGQVTAVGAGTANIQATFSGLVRRGGGDGDPGDAGQHPGHAVQRRAAGRDVDALPGDRPAVGRHLGRSRRRWRPGSRPTRRSRRSATPRRRAG